VPRIWEKIEDKLVSLGSQTVGMKKKLLIGQKLLGLMEQTHN